MSTTSKPTISIHCTVHCDQCGSGNCEHADKARERHALLLAKAMLFDEPINAREFYIETTRLALDTTARGIALVPHRFAVMETWTLGMFNVVVDFAEEFAKSVGRRLRDDPNE